MNKISKWFENNRDQIEKIFRAFSYTSALIFTVSFYYTLTEPLGGVSDGITKNVFLAYYSRNSLVVFFVLYLFLSRRYIDFFRKIAFDGMLVWGIVMGGVLLLALDEGGNAWFLPIVFSQALAVLLPANVIYFLVKFIQGRKKRN